MLQICIHYDAVISLGIGETGVDACLLAEITREGNIAHTLIIFRHDPQGAERAVLGAVVDEQIFKLQLRVGFLHGCGNLCDLFIEHRQDFLLVIARYND